MTSRSSRIDLAVLSVSAVVAIFAADRLLYLAVPPKHLREVEHGVRDLREGNPSVLVVGSSHARTFHDLGKELSRRTAGAEALVAVPLENGKLFAYDALMSDRLLPIVDQKSASGALVKNRLKRFLLLTEWWDSCPHGARRAYWNLPARVWEFGEFARDLLDNGLNAYNRNYLQNRFRSLFRQSALVHDRTQRDLLPAIVRKIRAKPGGTGADGERLRVAQWQRMVEAGVNCIGDPQQMASMRNVLEAARLRQWETIVVLFPRKPATLTAKAKATTLPKFASLVRAAAEPLGAAVIDLTDRSPLLDADFLEDFDHIGPEGNRKFANWALDHDLKFLLTPASGSRSGGAGR